MKIAINFRTGACSVNTMAAKVTTSFCLRVQNKFRRGNRHLISLLMERQLMKNILPWLNVNLNMYVNWQIPDPRIQSPSVNILVLIGISSNAANKMSTIAKFWMIQMHILSSLIALWTIVAKRTNPLPQKSRIIVRKRYGIMTKCFMSCSIQAQLTSGLHNHRKVR